VVQQIAPANDANTELAGKERILRAGREQLLARGYADVTMQEIADAVGLTKAAIYYHFGDKEGLFEAIYVAEMERTAAGIGAEVAQGGTLRDQLERVAVFMLTNGGSSLGRLITDMDRYGNPEHRKNLFNGPLHPFSVIRPAFEAAAEAGELASVDLDVAIALFFSMIFGQIRREAQGRPAPARPNVLAKSIANLMIDGIGAHPPAS
jgi:AcrR family transcriptional regulator